MKVYVKQSETGRVWIRVIDMSPREGHVQVFAGYDASLEVFVEPEDAWRIHDALRSHLLLLEQGATEDEEEARRAADLSRDAATYTEAQG